MTTTVESETTSAPQLACSECAAPMAEDQRYCLDCGARRHEVQTPVARPQTAAREPSTVALPPARGPRGWITGNVGLIGGVACLLLAMGVGVLIGHAGRAPAKVTAAPQVVTVSGAGTAAATPAQPSAPAKHAAAKHTSTKKKSSTSVSDLSKTTSPKDYAKKSKKLPNEITTHGKAVKKDHKKGGGGTDFESIG